MTIPYRNGLKQTGSLKRTPLAKKSVAYRKTENTIRYGVAANRICANSTLKSRSYKRAQQERGSFKKFGTLKPISEKRAKELEIYRGRKFDVLDKCRVPGGWFRSELSGKLSAYLEPHHIDGKQNARLFDIFNFIFITEAEHKIEQAHHSFEKIQELKAIVLKIRTEQGYVRL